MLMSEHSKRSNLIAFATEARLLQSDPRLARLARVNGIDPTATQAGAEQEFETWLQYADMDELTDLLETLHTPRRDPYATREQLIGEVRDSVAKLLGRPARPRKVTLDAQRMSRTEVSLRLATYLLGHEYATADVQVMLGKDQLRGVNRTRFPVEQFLTEHGFTRAGGESDWQGPYRPPTGSHALIVTAGRKAWDVTAPLAPDSRILVYAGGGPLEETRSSTESRVLGALIGHAVRDTKVQPLDVLAVAIPRSKRMRKLAQEARKAPRLGAAGLQVVTVDRTGDVYGLPFFDGPLD